MKPYLRSFLLVLLFSNCLPAAAQKAKAGKTSPYDIDTLIRPVAKQRLIFYDRIDREQKRADYFDGSGDQAIYFGEDTLASRLLTQALLRDIDQIQVLIENLPFANPQVENQEKVRYYTAVYSLLRRFNADTRVVPVSYRREVSNLRGMIIARQEGTLTDFVRANANVQSLRNAALLEGHPEARAALYTGLAKTEPALMIDRLNEYATEPYACDIIKEAATAVPGKVLTYALSTNRTLSGAVKRCNDPLVQTIVKIATQSQSPRKTLSFLALIHNGSSSIGEADRIASSPDLYFRHLVRMKLANERIGSDVYTDELKNRSVRYVRDMNDLHDSPDAVRFRGIEKFSPEELYFIIVYGVEEIYTSSYTGAFNRMVARMKSESGDALLDRVHRDHFRTFIRMCAYYGKLGEFLGTMKSEKRTALMQDFVAGLELGNKDDLEEAVDVADAFSCIEDPNLATFLQEEVDRHYGRCQQAGAPKGVRSYGLLADIFRSFRGDTTAGSQSGVPSANFCSFSSLRADSSGTVYVQAFYYGDEDGRGVFNSSMNAFPAGKWKIKKENDWWTTVRSTEGQPVVIFANNPLPEPGDEEAQRKLKAYLGENNIHPVMVIHRGHSYHLPGTIDGLQQQNRIIMLGSCGGYHNLGTVLERAPDAQIISTRQIGTYKVNKLIIDGILRQLQDGHDINWTQTWHRMEQTAAAQGPEVLKRFKDYVPPHKNLGAIFIKAYRRLAATETGL